MDKHLKELSDEKRQMHATYRELVDKEVIPFIRANREHEWTTPPEERQPWELLKAEDKLSLRTFGVPEKYGGIQLEKQAQIFAIFAEELSRSDLGFADIISSLWKVSVLLSNAALEHNQDEWFPHLMDDPNYPETAGTHSDSDNRPT